MWDCSSRFEPAVSRRDACRCLNDVNRKLRALRSEVIRDLEELQVYYRNERSAVGQEGHPLLTALLGSRVAARGRAKARLEIAQEKDAVMGPYRRIKHEINALMDWVRSHRDYMAAGYTPPAPGSE